MHIAQFAPLAEAVPPKLYGGTERSRILAYGGAAGDEIAGEVADKEVLDAAIVGAAQSVEIARYGTLIAWAEACGHDDIVRFLITNLNEEKVADKKLSTVALRKGVNRKAPAERLR